MTTDDWKKKLAEDGFDSIFVAHDKAGVVYPDHTHVNTTAHVILEGEMTLTREGNEKTLHVGERFDIPAGTTHSAKMGPEGCTYVVGE